MTDQQAVILEIFNEVKRILERHNIDYYAIGGTCIGAVRNGGFIPWDDDLDIAIPIEQYEEFLEYAETELPAYYKIINARNHRHFAGIHTKIADMRTTFVQRCLANRPQEYFGVFMDVMPMSGLPDDLRVRKHLYWKQAILYNMDRKRKRSYKENRSVAGLLVWLLVKILFFLPTNYYRDKWFQMLAKYPLKTAHEVGPGWSHRFSIRQFPQAEFRSYTEFPFESTSIRCPVGWDDHLRRDFGDYMTPPPEEKRVSKHTFFVDLKTPCAEYTKRGGIPV